MPILHVFYTKQVLFVLLRVYPFTYSLGGFAAQDGSTCFYVSAIYFLII